MEMKTKQGKERGSGKVWGKIRQPQMVQKVRAMVTATQKSLIQPQQ